MVAYTRPKRCEYDTIEKRLVTFVNWPEDHVLTELEAANAGMYYEGQEDCLRCFHCGGGLRNWEPHDNVWVEHARFFPKCEFLASSVGPDFVQVVSELRAEWSRIDMETIHNRLCHLHNQRIEMKETGERKN